MNPRAILFDLDDTLNDRQRTLEIFAPKFLEDYGHRLVAPNLEQMRFTLQSADQSGYRPRDEFMLKVMENLNWISMPAHTELLAYWFRVFPAISQPMPGMRDVLIELRSRGLQLGIVSNGKTRTQNDKVDVLGLRALVDVVLVSEDAGIKKPNPRIFQIALERLQLEAVQVWMVGDHPVNDVLGARGAGLTGVWLKGATHAWPDDAERGLEIESLPELLELLT
jgi:putative hydrolase of the HAD superfamily